MCVSLEINTHTGTYRIINGTYSQYLLPCEVGGELPGDGGGTGFAHGLVAYLPLTSGTDTLTSGTPAPLKEICLRGNNKVIIYFLIS